MSDSLRMSRVTVTLGRDGRVVKSGGGLSEEGTWNGVPNASSKRSVRDRLGGVAGEDRDRDTLYSKRQRGESTSNSIDTCLRKDDLRFKLMQKGAGQESLNDESQRSFDLRDKLSRKTSRPSADIMTTRPAESFSSVRPFVHDPRVNSMTWHPELETRDMSILGRFHPSRNPNGLSAMGPPPQSYSSWNLENLRRRSPVNLRQRSPPQVLRRRSPEVLRRRSPEVLRRRSPEVMRRSPVVLRRRSPMVIRRRSPEVLRRRSPVGLRRSSESLRRLSPESLGRRSPNGLGRRSPNGLGRRSPNGLGRRSPNGLGRRSPEGLRQRSPEGLRRRPMEGLRQRSPVVLRRRSPKVMRLRSPDGLRRRSPDGLRGSSVEGMRRRSPERPFHPSVARVHSPLRSREDIQRRPLVRPYDDERSTAYLRMSPRRAARSPPYPSVISVAPAPRYPQPEGIMQRIPPGADGPPTVDSFLLSIGMEKYAILFKAEEIDLNALRQLGDGDLKDLGIPMGPRKAILQAIMARGRRPF